MRLGETNEHFIRFFEAKLSGGDPTEPNERLILESLSDEDRACVLNLFANVRDLFEGTGPGQTDTLEEPASDRITLKSAKATLRTLLGGAMFLLLLCSGILLLAGFYDNWRNDLGFLALAQLGGYAACLALIYYLEGGQAARFMAKGDPPEMHGVRFRPFLVKDLLNEQSIQRYVGIRQFFTLGVTTISYAFFVKTWSLSQFPFIGPVAADAVLLLSHLLFTTTLFQILPQLRANKDRAFANTSGSVLTYHACETIAKVFDPSLPAHYVDQMARKARPSSNGREAAAGATEDDDPVFVTRNVSKFKTDGEWQSPSEVKAILERNGMRADVDWLAVPSATHHLPPHYPLAILIMINKSLGPASEALQYTVLNAFSKVVENNTKG